METQMAVTTVFIEQPSSWDAVATSLRQLSRERARTVRFAGAIDELDADLHAIDVVVFSVGGMAKYALEIHEKGLLGLPDDTIGMHLACSTNANVLVQDNVGFPLAWLLRPDGRLEQVVLDADKLGMSRVEYRIGEQDDPREWPNAPDSNS
jgi:hypothetical protein